MRAGYARRIERNNGHHALAQALARQGVAPALKPFSLGKTEAVEALFADVGFRIAALRTEERAAEFPSVEAFIQGVAAGAPTTRHALAQLADDRRQAFAKDVPRILEPCLGGGCLRLPTWSHIVLATPA